MHIDMCVLPHFGPPLGPGTARSCPADHRPGWPIGTGRENRSDHWIDQITDQTNLVHDVQLALKLKKTYQLGYKMVKYF